MSDNLRDKLGKDIDFTLWDGLHAHFVRDKVFVVDGTEKLIDVAVAVAENDTSKVQQWIETKKVDRPDGFQVQEWRAKKQVFLCVVVEPFVLIQLSDYKGELKQNQ